MGWIDSRPLRLSYCHELWCWAFIYVLGQNFLISPDSLWSVEIQQRSDKRNSCQGHIFFRINRSQDMLESAIFAWFLLTCSQPTPFPVSQPPSCDIHCLEIIGCRNLTCTSNLFHDTSVTLDFLLLSLVLSPDA